MIINLSDIAILNIKRSDYCCIITLISKTEAIDLMQNADLTKKLQHYKKMENYKLKKNFERYEMEKVIKFGDIEIQKQKFHQHKGRISMKNININKIVVSNKASFGKKDFKYFIGYKDAKKLNLYVYFFQE